MSLTVLEVAVLPTLGEYPGQRHDARLYRQAGMTPLEAQLWDDIAASHPTKEQPFTSTTTERIALWRAGVTPEATKTFPVHVKSAEIFRLLIAGVSVAQRRSWATKLTRYARKYASRPYPSNPAESPSWLLANITDFIDDGLTPEDIEPFFKHNVLGSSIVLIGLRNQIPAAYLSARQDSVNKAAIRSGRTNTALVEREHVRRWQVVVDKYALGDAALARNVVNTVGMDGTSARHVLLVAHGVSLKRLSEFLTAGVTGEELQGDPTLLNADSATLASLAALRAA